MHGYETDTVTKRETNLDDCPAEVLGAVMEKLFADGALDVWFTPIQMKKHRPATMLSVLCEPAVVDKMAGILFSETTAFGLRVESVVRLKLARRFVQVETIYGPVKVKLGMQGERIIQFAPEFESCRALAAQANVPLKEVFAAAQAMRPGVG